MRALEAAGKQHQPAINPFKGGALTATTAATSTRDAVVTGPNPIVEGQAQTYRAAGVAAAQGATICQKARHEGCYEDLLRSHSVAPPLSQS